MSARKYFSYIRVSTLRQGQTGTSLDEQRAAIERYAARSGLEIVQEFEEKETAAKRGRPVFTQMLKGLRQGRASGVVMHKIDRSARNLRDWADLAELIDGGIEVHFANESLDLHSRGGRLSADIQAVVAADFIRNLREETRKGFFGRLRQGFYPRPAPVGYLDRGGGKPKEVDPVQGPLVRQAFDLYATGNWTLAELVKRMTEAGLRGKGGRPVSVNGMSCLLRNPFYIGVVRVRTRGETFSGQHRPLITRAVFERVRRVLEGKKAVKEHKHFMLFRRLLVCAACGRTMIGEVQREWIYYRCHTKRCPQKSIREDVIESAVKDLLMEIRFTPLENVWLRKQMKQLWVEYSDLRLAQSTAGHLRLEQIQERLAKLADALIDGVLDRETYLNKKNDLVLEEQALREDLKFVDAGREQVMRRVENFIELVNDAYSSWEMADRELKAEFAKILTSNIVVEGKKVILKLNNPFRILESRESVPAGRAHRGVPRTLGTIIRQLLDHFSNNQFKNAFASETQMLAPVRTCSKPTCMLSH